jgi:hypothetical protein
MKTIFLFIFYSILHITVPYKFLWASENTFKNKEKLRLIMMSDFPPIGVVKEGDDVPNTMKSDPDDMQSMVRFLIVCQ